MKMGWDFNNVLLEHPKFTHESCPSITEYHNCLCCTISYLDAFYQKMNKFSFPSSMGRGTSLRVLSNKPKNDTPCLLLAGKVKD